MLKRAQHCLFTQQTHQHWHFQALHEERVKEEGGAGHIDADLQFPEWQAAFSIVERAGKEYGRR